MKELDFPSLLPEKEKTEISQQKQHEYQLVYYDTIVPHEGHRIFEIDLVTQEITEAKYDYGNYIYDPFWSPKKKASSNGKLIMNQGKAYVSAMNAENALKKFKTGSTGTKIDKNKIYLEL